MKGLITMAALLIGEDLFHCGLFVVGAAVILLLIAIILLTQAFRKLRRKLDQEYGKKRH